MESETHSPEKPGQPRHRLAVCRCDCGAQVSVRVVSLVSGRARSCGCLNAEKAAERMRSLNVSMRGQRSSQLRRYYESDASASERARRKAAKRTHGLTGHPLYGVWQMMLARCEDPGHRGYKNYGGRGVRICPEWHDVAMFIAWIEANLGPRPDDCYPNGWPKYTIDRINNNGGYEPGNVRWATYPQQHANKRKRRAG